MIERDDLGHELLLCLHIAEELNVVDGRLKPVICPDLGVELPELVAKRLRLEETPERSVMVEPMGCDRLGLREVVVEQLPVHRLLVVQVTCKQVVQAAMEDVRPVEGLRHFPREAVERRRHLLFVGRDAR